MSRKYGNLYAKNGTFAAHDREYGNSIVENRRGEQVSNSLRPSIYEASDRNIVTQERFNSSTSSEPTKHQPHYTQTKLKDQNASSAEFRRNISFNKLSQHYQRQTENNDQVPRPNSNYVSSPLQSSRSMTDLRSAGTPPIYGYFICEVPDEFERKICSKSCASMVDVKKAACSADRRTVDYSASKGVAALRASFEEKSLKAKEIVVPVKPRQQNCSSTTATATDGRLATRPDNSRSQSLPPRSAAAVQKTTLANGSPMTSSSGYESRGSADTRSMQPMKAFSQKSLIEDIKSSTSSAFEDPITQRSKPYCQVDREPFALNRWSWQYNTEVAARQNDQVEMDDSLNQKYANFISLLEAKYAHVPANDEVVPNPILNHPIPNPPVLRSQHFQGVYSSPDGITRWLVDVNAKGHDEDIVQKKTISKSQSNYSFPSESSTTTKCCTTITVELTKPPPLIINDEDEKERASVVESPIMRSYAPRKVNSSAPQFAHLGAFQNKFSHQDDCDNFSDSSYKQPVENWFHEAIPDVYPRQQQENRDPQHETWKRLTNSEVENRNSSKFSSQRPSSFQNKEYFSTHAGKSDELVSKQEPSWTNLAKNRSSHINANDFYRPKSIPSQEPSWTVLARQRSEAANFALRQRNSEPSDNPETSLLNSQAKEWMESAKRLAYNPTKDYGYDYDNEDYRDSD